MVKKVLIGALIGWVVLAVWTFVVNGMLGFRVRVDMKQIANEGQVYAMLKDNVVEPGRYVFNPELTETGFVQNEPVFSVLYSGFGHEAAGRESLVNLVNALFMSLIAAWMLSMASDHIQQRYANRVLFYAVIGLFLAVAGEIPKYGIGGYPANSTFLLAVHAVVQWTVVGLFVAWRMKPDS